MTGFEIKLALRHLRSGGGQTLLTVAAVAAGVTVVIFISSLVFGIRAHVSDVLTDMLPSVTVSPPDPLPTSLRDAGVGGYGPSSSRIERQTQQTKYIDNWPSVVREIQALPGVVSAAPVVDGQAFISRGGRRLGALLTGAEPARLNTVQHLTKYVTAGSYVSLASDEILVNYKLVTELAIGLGDRVIVTSSSGLARSFRVAGILDTGQSPAGIAYVNLRPGQSLFGTGGSVTAVYVRCDDLFHADQVADRITAIFPYRVDSWSRLYPEFVSSLGAYEAVAYLVSTFSLVASGFAIASVLIVSVIQRGRQIGILKGIGARSGQIQAIFLFEGLGVAIFGAAVGAGAGCAVVRGLSAFKQAGSHPGVPPQDLFPSHLTWQLVVIAMFAAILTTVAAAVLPARRAARLNPVEVIK